MLGHQTLVCIYLHAAVLITVIHVLCLKSERMIEGELARGYFTRYGLTSGDHVIMCFQHKESCAAV